MLFNKIIAIMDFVWIVDKGIEGPVVFASEGRAIEYVRHTFRKYSNYDDSLVSIREENGGKMYVYFTCFIFVKRYSVY